MHYSHTAAEHAADMYGTPIARTVFGFDSFLGLPQDDPAAHESFKGRCARPGEGRRLEQPRSSPGAEEQGPPHLLLLTFSSSPSPPHLLLLLYHFLLLRLTPHPNRRGIYADLINSSVEVDGSGPSGSFSSGK